MIEPWRKSWWAMLGGALAVAAILPVLQCPPALAQTESMQAESTQAEPTQITPQATTEPKPSESNTTFGALSKNKGEPIDIESDVLVVHDAKKYATFKGNVKAVQGTTTIRSTELDVHYVGSGGDALTGGAEATPAADKPAQGAGLGQGNGTQISQIEARGNVIITGENEQTTTSDWALYDVPTQIVTVGGNVVLMQGKNMLKGDRLVIDLKTGESRFENQDRTVAGGRIRALFVPKEEEGKARKKTDESADSAETESAEADSSEKEARKERAAEKAARKQERKASGGMWNQEPNSLR
jgi:lipopolysaccharide export system protein LptA